MIGFVLNTCNYSSIRWYTCMIMYRKFLIKSFRYEFMYNSMHAHLCNKKLHLIYERYERFNFVWMMNYIVYFFVVFIYLFFFKINRYVFILFIFEMLFIYFISELTHYSSILLVSIYSTLFIYFYAFIYVYLWPNS